MTIQIGERIFISDQKPLKEPKELLIKFDDPPGPTPAWCILPLTISEEEIDRFKDELKEDGLNIEIGGEVCLAHTGEGYVFFGILIGGIVAGIGSGIFNAIGEDIWQKIKTFGTSVFKRNSNKYNVFEIVMELSDYDVILHYESRKPLILPKRLDDADKILSELNQAISKPPQFFKNCKTIELRLQDDKKYSCVLHSYRYSKKIKKMKEKKKKKKK